MNIEPYLIRNATHFVLPRAEIGNGAHAMVKEAAYFRSCGGLSGKKNRDGRAWGDNWIPVNAEGLEHARLLAWFIGSGTAYPESCSFQPPNTRTVGEILADHAGTLAKEASSSKQVLARILGYEGSNDLIWEKWEQSGHGGYQLRVVDGPVYMFLGYDDVPGTRHVPDLGVYWDDPVGALLHTCRDYQKRMARSPTRKFVG